MLNKFKNRPYWVKGGIIGVIIGLIVYKVFLMIFLGHWQYTDINLNLYEDEGTTPYSFKLIIWLVAFHSLAAPFAGPFGSLVLFAGLIYYFVIGSIIGWIYGKIKRKKYNA